MLIVTCVKQVPDTTQVSIDPVTNTLIREGVPFIMNPYDRHALEESLRLKDRYGFRVVAVSMGPPNADVTLRQALAAGVDEVVLLSDRAFAGADTLATSKVLAEAIARLARQDELALVICGQQTIDGDTAQVGPGIATRLKLPLLTLVDRVDSVNLETRRIIVRRKLEGRRERVESRVPALLTVVREINRPRYPAVPKRLAAAEAAVITWNNKTLELDPATIGLKGSPTKVNRIFSPQRAKGEIIGDGMNDPEATAGQLVARMMEKDLLSL